LLGEVQSESLLEEVQSESLRENKRSIESERERDIREREMRCEDFGTRLGVW